MSQKVVLASRNAGKLAELREVLRGRVAGLNVDEDLINVADLEDTDVVEDGVTFEQNALKKAREVSAHTGMVALADDSGLAVNVLGGAPGIFSARWSGQHGDDEANLNLLLSQLSDIDDPHRGAAFVCAAAVAAPEGEEHVVEGRLVGTLLKAPRGEGGFGYDPILAPEGSQYSCAELTAEQKNEISHRGQAFRALATSIETVLKNRAGQA